MVVLSRNYYPHWLVFEIPANVTSLPAAIPHQEVLPNGAKQVDIWNRGYGYQPLTDYVPGAPTEPTYTFTVYARSHATEPRVTTTTDAYLARNYLRTGALAEASITVTQPRAAGTCTP